LNEPYTLPLPPAVFQILVALADQDRHGYAIMQNVAARTDGRMKLRLLRQARAVGLTPRRSTS
jgi:hypothetical protein